MKQKFNITGMTCSACSAHVEKAVNQLPGIKTAAVSLMTNSMSAEYDERQLSEQDAYAYLRHLSMDKGISMTELAKMLLKAYEK